MENKVSMVYSHRRRLGVLAALLLVVALVLSACGDGDNTGTTPSGAGTTPGTQATGTTGSTTDLQGATLEVAAVWTGAEQDAFQKVIDEFQKQTGAQVTYTSTGDDIATVLGTRLQGGSPPDVAFLPQPGLLYGLAEQGALIPLDDVIGDKMGDNYVPIWKELMTVDGKLYGLVFKAANKSTMWYNTGVFQNAGVQPPATWDDLLKTADTISASGVPPFSVGGADGWTLTDWFENVYLRVAGPDKYDQLTKHEIPWTDDSVRQTLTELQKVFASDLLAGGTTGALQTDFPTSVTNVFTDPAKAAIVYEGDFVAGVITAQTKAKLGTDADFFDFPSINDSPSSVVVGGDSAVMMKDTPVARAFVQFLTDPKPSEIWASVGGFSSPNKSVSSDAYPDDISRRAAASLANAEQVRFDLSDLTPPAFGGTPSKGMWQDLQEFLRNPQDIDGTMQSLERNAASAYGPSGANTTTTAAQ